MMRIIKRIGSWIGSGARAFVVLVGVAGVGSAVANYAMTQGSGTTFGSVVVGGVHYAQMFLCDLTTPAQCATVSAGGAVKVDGSAATQPVSAASLPLPTGAATAAKQPALGTAGSASTDILTVQGIASMTPFLANPGTAANWGVGATGSAVPASGIYHALNVGGTLRGVTGLSLGSTFSQTVAIVDASGNQITAFGGSGGTASNYGSAFPSSGTAIGYTDGTNMVAARVGAVANVAAATNFVNALGICNYNAAPLTVTDTRYQSIQCDVNGFLKVNVTNTNANGATTASASSPVTIATDQVAVAMKAASGVIASGAMVDLGAQADSVCSTDTGTCTLIALTKRNNARLTTLNTSIGAANAYETVAASQTAQAMGATGATGDFLSHCVVTPGTTSPGVVTVLDNATAIVSFAGGASSVSNLVPFTIPVGAVSVSGAWKITTGANVTVVCVGRFT